MKKTLRKLLAFMVVAVLVVSMCVTPTFASQVTSTTACVMAETPEKDFACVVLGDGTVEIAGYIGKSSDVVIPDTIDGRKVTSIGNSAFFRNAQVTEITIPSGVTEIGNYAFSYCDSLRKITIPSSVANIAQDAFVNRSDELIIYCFKNTSASAFAKNNNICRAEFSYNVLGDGTAEIRAYYENAKYVDIPSTVDGYVVTSIGDQSFIFSDVESVTIPETVTKIDDYAFCQCQSLKSVKMPKTLTYLGDYAFGYCTSLPEITIPEGTPWIGESTFSHCSSLKSVVIPEGADFINTYAFSVCSSLTSIYIPASVRYIYDNSFIDCADSLVICGVTGSYAQTFAQNNGISFTSLR